MKNIINFKNLNLNDLNKVGGKNSSLGEMISNLSNSGVKVPGGFATTVDFYKKFISNINTQINDILNSLDIEDLDALANSGKKIRDLIMQQDFNKEFKNEISAGYKEMEAEFGKNCSVAVRSSATAEDLPNASFAGQQETFLNVVGIDNVIACIKEVFASLFNDRAISYRVHQNFDHSQVSISAGIQKMVRSDLASSGVMFSLHTESGFEKVVFITSSFGLGEMVVQGSVNPDEFYVYKDNLNKNIPSVLRKNIGSKVNKMIFSTDKTKKVKIIKVPEEDKNNFSITDEQIEELARIAVKIENHYKKPMDIEWALDGETNELFIVQARPETVESRKKTNLIEEYKLKQKANILLEGLAIGRKIGIGVCRIIDNPKHINQVQKGDILVTDMTDPDWEPVMKKASALVTNRGGRTCHAAIIARELGIPAIVGSTNGTEILKENQEVTVSCAEGDVGYIYEGLLDYEVIKTDFSNMAKIKTKIMMNVGNPSRAFFFAQIPNDGVGLARLEFLINSNIGIHPKALLEFNKQSDELKKIISQKISGYASPKEFYIEKLKEGIATIAASFAPNPVIVRMSDFKTNEYANLIGGAKYEAEEENPMLGFRGASRYLNPDFYECWLMEIEALKRVRKEMNLTNVQIMIPFVRTLKEGQEVIDLLAKNGLKSGDDGLKIIVMCELPSNALLADEFLDIFDGMSIGSNDMTQLTLGLDRDSAIIAHMFDERDLAVKKMLKMAIDAAKRKNKYIGICGQGPSDHPELAEWLVKEGISSLSLNPDTVVSTWNKIAGK